MEINLEPIKEYVLPHFQWLWDESDYHSFYLSGGRGSSKTTALIQLMIVKSFDDKGYNILIVRGTYASHKDTTFQEFIDWISIFNMEQFFNVTKNPLEIENVVTGSKIYFRGVDQGGHKLKGLKRVANVMFEEANIGITKSDVDTIVGGMRGVDEINYYYCYNPINPFSCWIKPITDEIEKWDAVHHHSTFKQNPFNGTAYLKTIMLIRKNNIDTYNNLYLGRYGSFEDLVLDNTKIVDWDGKEPSFDNDLYHGLGVDFGFTKGHEQTFAYTIYDKTNNDLYVVQSYGETKVQTIDWMKTFDKTLQIIPSKFCDSARADLLDVLNTDGWGWKGCYKTSLMQPAFITWFNNLNHCYVSEDAKPFVKDASMWSYHKGKPEDKNDNYVDALRYSLQDQIKPLLVNGKIEFF